MNGPTSSWALDWRQTEAQFRAKMPTIVPSSCSRIEYRSSVQSPPFLTQSVHHLSSSSSHCQLSTVMSEIARVSIEKCMRQPFTIIPWTCLKLRSSHCQWRMNELIMDKLSPFASMMISAKQEMSFDVGLCHTIKTLTVTIDKMTSFQN